MPPATAGEKEREELGAPQTPAGGLRPPAPPAEQLKSGFERNDTWQTTKR